MAGLGQRDTNTHGSPGLARSLAKRSISSFTFIKHVTSVAMR